MSIRSDIADMITTYSLCVFCVWLSALAHEPVSCVCVCLCLCKLSPLLSGWRKEQPAPSAYRPSAREAQASGHLCSTIWNVGSSLYRPNDLLHRTPFHTPYLALRMMLRDAHSLLIAPLLHFRFVDTANMFSLLKL